MRISYSGIELEVIHLVNFERVPVLSDDSVDYLFTKFTITAVGLVSSDQVDASLRSQNSDTIGMSYQSESGATLAAGAPATVGLPPSVFHTPSSNPIITDVAIRHWLSVPRRRLRIENESTITPLILLQSPKAGFGVDAHNGPFPEVFAVQQVFGDARLFMVSLRVTTYVSECEENAGIAGAFLSNRFSQEQHIDEDGYITIKTDGEARFRTDFVYDQVNPDVLRPYLFLPIPNGFKRQDIVVQGMSDVSGFRYTFLDEQMRQQLVVGDEINATRVEVNCRQAMVTNEDALGTVLNTIASVQQTRLNRKWLLERDNPKPLPKVIPSRLGVLKGAK
jgi:hypothetical protein